jgi:hypothetical protein
MSRVIIDAWTLHRAFHQLSVNENSIICSDMEKLCMGNLLTGIILWDEIVWVSDKYTEYYFNRLNKTKSINQLTGLFNKRETYNFEKFNSILPDLEYRERSKMDIYLKDDMSKILRRSELYLKWSEDLGINYFPHPKRADYIIQQGIIEKRFKRNEILNIIDGNLIDYALPLFYSREP